MGLSPKLPIECSVWRAPASVCSLFWVCFGHWLMKKAWAGRITCPAPSRPRTNSKPAFSAASDRDSPSFLARSPLFRVAVCLHAGLGDRIKKPMNIQFDERNLLADVVGKADGLTRSEVERSQSKALKALKAFQKKSEQ